jgi:multiple sugar transport system permease protein
MTSLSAKATPTSKAMPANVGSVSRANRSTRFWVYLFLTFLGVVFMFPWLWTMTTSLKTAPETYLYPPPLFPAVPQWSNYPGVFARIPFGLWMLNSTVVVALATSGTIFSASLVAYSFARFRWRGRDIIFAITLATMMLPAEVTLIPTYMIFRTLRWLNTIRPLWVPAWFGGAFAIFLMRQFIMTIPRELDEAATIDGASPFRILVTVLLPLMKPVMATLTIMSIIWGWNDFMGPLIYLASPEKFTLALGLRYFDVVPDQAQFPQRHFLMAACVMSTTPIILLFFAGQRYFVQGIVMSGIKG